MSKNDPHCTPVKTNGPVVSEESHNAHDNDAEAAEGHHESSSSSACCYCYNNCCTMLNHSNNNHNKSNNIVMSILTKPWDWAVSSYDHRPKWRQMIAWSKSDGEELRRYVTSRLESNMIVLALLLGILISFIYDSGTVPSAVREALYETKYTTLAYYIGLIVLISIFVIVYAIITNYIGWSMIASIGTNNITTMLRTPIGQYTYTITSRLVLLSFRLFLLWCTLFMIYLVNVTTAIILTIMSAIFYFHIIYVYRIYGQFILYSGSMKHEQMIDENILNKMSPKNIQIKLYKICNENRKHLRNTTSSSNDLPLSMQYEQRLWKVWYTAIFSHRFANNENEQEVFNTSSCSKQQHQQQESDEEEPAVDGIIYHYSNDHSA